MRGAGVAVAVLLLRYPCCCAALQNMMPTGAIMRVVIRRLGRWFDQHQARFGARLSLALSGRCTWLYGVDDHPKVDAWSHPVVRT